MKSFVALFITLALTLPVFGAGKQETGAKIPTEKVTLNVIVRKYALNQESPYISAKAILEKNHPNVTVNLEGLGYDDTRNKTLITVGANQQLDVVQLDYIWVGEYAEGKILLPITDRVKKDSELYKDIIPQFLDSSSWKGEIYGLWINTDVRIIGWIKEYLKKAGLDPEKAPATYEELVQNAMKAQNPPEVSGYFFPLISGEATVERWFSPLFSYGGQILSKDFKKAEFNSPAGVKALQFYVDCVNKDKIIPQVAYESEEVDQLVWNKRLVYAFDFFAWEKAREAGWTVDKYHEAFGTAVPPKFKDGKVATTSGGYELGIPRTAVSPDLSFEFIKIATSTDNVKGFYAAQARLGTRKSLSKYTGELAKNNPDYQTQAKALEFTHFAPWNPEYVPMLEPLYTAIQKATMLKATPQQALDEAAAAANKLLAK